MPSPLAAGTLDRPDRGFSVLMAVYAGEQPEYLAEALESLCACHGGIAELVLVEDGPLTPALREMIEIFRTRLPLRSVALATNQGLGPALNAGLDACSQPWVARFDTDDLVEPHRFERQVNWLCAHPDVDICGGWIREFDETPDVEPGRIRRVPESHAEIKAYARSRNPFNHMTVMFRREAALAAGGYGNEPMYEDYALWVRMLQRGALAANLPEVLVRARAGRSMFARRGGWKYVASEWAMQRTFLSGRFISPLRFLANLAVRVPVRLLPNALRGAVYRLFLRR
ncbi:glycosyltransferase [Achromobacter ruhlandii]|uniref:glycosyltransferase n=1 Tax=Achromobacter ruhlandii TaxID=72557 RepID=UPI0006BFC7AA|nr:glycosyltransferase [Achromobacter ruhlandii]AMG44380.1 amylovoran biosynthesis protein AmsE [Achromobacter xylosoxidans]CUJ29512.1 putative glycosyl transferase [Achromobacter ruhlandii]CUJ36764.1 putative glycosyl transferase [Achromobacter ruhlandii]CUK16580.1 putative glycosyl transferase [Achromobacter ruhlandii]